MVQHARKEHPTEAELRRNGGPEGAPLDAVVWASDSARQLAEEEGLVPMALRRATSPSGRGGRYTVRDVRFAARQNPRQEG